MPSTAIASHRYDPRRRALFIRFQNGGEYLYDGVPETVGLGLAGAVSKGRFFQDRILDRYPFKRLDRP